MKSDKYCIFGVVKSFNQVIIITEENMIVVRDPKGFVLNLIGLNVLMRI